MRLLVLDTTGASCSAALRRPGQADLILSEEIRRGHAERLAPMAEQLLGEAGLAPHDLDRIGVTTGPGSFAGVRVGVAFARGLSLALGVPAAGVSTLAVLARQADPKSARRIAIVHDARRGEIVIQAFDKGRPLAPPETIPSGEEAAWRARMETPVVEASETLDLMALLDLAGEAPHPDGPPSPFYARPPDAKRPGGVSP